jgi:hypothetical protein
MRTRRLERDGGKVGRKEGGKVRVEKREKQKKN